MGIETTPVFENELPQILWGFYEWKTMTDATDRLAGLARSLSVVPLDQFVSFAREDALAGTDEDEIEEMEAEAQLRDGNYFIADDLLWSLERHWFSPEEGVKTAETLLSHLKNHPEFWSENDRENQDDKALLDILEGFVAVMHEAKRRNVRFYLKVWV